MGSRPTRSRRRRPQTTPEQRAAREAGRSRLVEKGRLGAPDTLPIADRYAELVETIANHQVVVVAGETGSGKSTQLPKICLAAGRGVEGMIGHTQPRRVAARTIAERVAEEVGSKLGEDVGYAVRFTDEVGDGTLVKVMTDGILLAEIQRDRDLRRYDTIIIDEAHERSLNIDFLLGYLAQLLPRRPDLTLIITSATIDTERFARHFARDGVDAPIVEVSGRSYPVEVRYRPYEEDERDQVQAILDAVDELSLEGPGDVLVFLSGEREIHDTADAIRRRRDPNTEVLPLYARLSSHEQHRIFQPHTGRRVVLSTNVAETSLTVPGVRYVVDAGTARISRYSRRLKVQRLPIEPVSQASANQRAGRCGRVAPGICIRLFSGEDFEQRPEFTEPEILRTNLASVILQMTAIGLGDVARFPFVEPPDSRAIRDGYLLLEELAAIEPSSRDDGRRQLTKIGRRLARLPVDPRLGRMVLEADRHGCVREVLVIAAALSIQDVRERPQENREQAAQLHARFRVPGSDLLTIVKLWDHLREQQRELSGNQFRRMCRTEYLHYLRVREWTDLYSQLRRVAGDLGIRPGTDEGHPDRVHQAVLAGHLSHVGQRDGERRDYHGARQAQFVIAPGSVLTRRPPDWVVATELVETDRLYARRLAAIDPTWAERAGAHLVKRSYGEPRWDERGARAVTTEQVTLYGLPLVSDRVVGLDKVDPDEARAWFISRALVHGEWRTQHHFVARNAEFLTHLESLSARVRGGTLLDPEDLFHFYDARVGDDVVSGRHFDKWWKDARRNDSHLLDLDESIVREHGISVDDFPDVWQQGDLELPLTYRYAPGEPLDGVTVHVPLAWLNQVSPDGFDWQIPGNRPDLVDAFVRSLPKQIRRSLIPLAETVDEVIDRLPAPSGRFLDALASTVSSVADVKVVPSDFDRANLPGHLSVNFVVSDEDGAVHDVGTDLAAIRNRLAGTARETIAAAAPVDERRGITDWDIGDLERVVETTDRNLDVKAYPTLLDVGSSVSLRVVSTPELQGRAMHGGVRRLLLLTAAPSRRRLERLITERGRLSLATADIPLEVLLDDCIAAAVDAVLREQPGLPWTEQEFRDLQVVVRAQTASRAGRALAAAAGIIDSATGVRDRLAQLKAPSVRASVGDANEQLGRLVRPGFVLAAGLDRLPDIDRYVKALAYRLDHLSGHIPRDQQRMAEIRPLEIRYRALVDRLEPGEASPAIADMEWQLEELRVALFAQPLASGGVSVKKMTRSLAALGA